MTFRSLRCAGKSNLLNFFIDNIITEIGNNDSVQAMKERQPAKRATFSPFNIEKPILTLHRIESARFTL